MMKILNFLQWQWRKFQAWQKWFLLCFALLGAATTAPDSARIWLLIPGASIPLFFTFKWCIWDGVKHSWKEYQNEQQKILDIIEGKK